MAPAGMSVQPRPALPLRRVHHLGYWVPDLELAIDRAVTTLGAGPFIMIEHVPLQQVTSHGRPARLEHSTAFAQWGNIVIELSEFYACEPERLRDVFAHSGPHLHHVAWAVDDLQAASRGCAAAGAPAILTARLDEVSFVFHDARAQWGHHVEIHHDSPGFRAFFDEVRLASIGWDGSDPIRSPEVGAPRSPRRHGS